MDRHVRVRNVYPFVAADRELLASVDRRYEIVHEGEDTAEWVGSLRDPEVGILMASEAPRDLAGTPRLRWLATAGAGIDDLVLADPWALGLTVTNGSGVHAVAIAEYVLGAALLVSERIEARLANGARRSWADARWPLAGRGLRGRTALIVGYGSIGREVARLLHAVGMRILAVKADPERRRDEGWREAGTGDPDGSIPERLAGPDALPALAGDAHLVVLAMPATPATRAVLDASLLAVLRSDAWIVNVGRGAAIDEVALLDALRAGRIGGAVLDVVTQEPLPADHPLWSEPRCLVTPHLSGLGDIDALWHRVALLMAEQLRRDAAGEPLLNVTSRARGY
ncbi:MAG: D-2-hydroxyacid dehydrogenase [Chloroflexi bacterium]|nr:D-2-hydroxyacid dehydrogenase [Chloroflexota bacterium]